MSYLPKLAAMVALFGAAVLGAACVGEPARIGEGTPSPNAIQPEEVGQSSDADSTYDDPIGESSDLQRWGGRERMCWRFRRCLRDYGYRACERWMPRAAYFCRGGGYPGGGYPGGGYPGGDYPGGDYPGGDWDENYPGGDGDDGYRGGGDGRGHGGDDGRGER